MKSKVVFYFSGSGNSYAIARSIAFSIDAELLPVKVLLQADELSMKNEIAGFVFPVYDFKPPQIVSDCLKKITANNNTYIFAVATYGLSASDAVENFANEIKKAGFELSAGYSIAMPHNGIFSGGASEQLNQKRLDRSREKVREIIGNINNRVEIIEKKQNILAAFIKNRMFKMIPGFIKFLFIVLTKGVHALDYKSNNDLCNSCGTCVLICPVNNIELKNGKPEWGDHCANCFGCLNWCPQEAISLGGYDMNIKHYHHPDVTIKEMSI